MSDSAARQIEAQWKKIDVLNREVSETKSRMCVAESKIKELEKTSRDNRAEIKTDAEKIIATLSSVNTKLDQYEGGLRIGRYIVRVGIGLSGALILFKSGDWLAAFKSILTGLAGQ